VVELDEVPVVTEAGRAPPAGKHRGHGNDGREADRREADHPEVDHPEADHPEADRREADRREADRDRRVWNILGSIPDPEIPVLSICDLGIVRHVRWSNTENAQPVLHVGLTPTYSGCPATEIIRDSVCATLTGAGYAAVVVEDVLSPPWSSDWLTEAGRDKLRSFGIAPPETSLSSPRQLFRSTPVACPRCGSRTTERISEFGSTPCKAHYRCKSCLEPFDYFKCL
jgi:ring-1,2-phenylacetyl-CoA epoxidase subunit PaaD